MMNNPWYRVVVHREPRALRFEHPTQPALMPGGWMERVKKEGGNISNGFWGEKTAGEDAAAGAGPAQEAAVKEISMVDDKVGRQITAGELAQHDGEDQPWFVVNGQVYDGTKFLEGHPGGAASIINAAGQDVSEEFLAIRKSPLFFSSSHPPMTPTNPSLPPKTDSENAKAMMPAYHIGTLAPSTSPDSAPEPEPEDDASTYPIFLHPKTWRRALLARKQPISHDTTVFHFTLAHAAQHVGLPVGQHLMIRLRDPATREAIIRAYTPLPSEEEELGALRVLVKIYKADERAGLAGGKMTTALDSLPVGHPVEFKGPVGKFVYHSGRGGMCAINGRERRVRRFVMICGGSGITPVFAVLRAVMREVRVMQQRKTIEQEKGGNGEDEEDVTPPECVLLDGNRVEEDILLRAELEEMEREGEGRCRVVHALSRPGDGWTGLRGRLDRAVFEREVGAPPAERDAMVLVCGPEGLERATREAFLGMGWHEDDLLFF
jgi:nitrate reductase (NAD(P)H)